MTSSREFTVKECPKWLLTGSNWKLLRYIVESKHDLDVANMRSWWSSLGNLERAGLIEVVGGLWCPTFRGREALRVWSELETILSPPAEAEPPA